MKLTYVFRIGVAAGSGMAATTMLCQMLKSGDHIVAMNDLYGGNWAGDRGLPKVLNDAVLADIWFIQLAYICYNCCYFR